MKNTMFIVIAIILSLVSVPAMAQMPIPGGASSPMSITQTGLTGKVLSYSGGGTTNSVPVSVTLSLLRQDTETLEMFPDHSTAKKFGPCENGMTVDCVAADGSYTITSLPKPENTWESWRTLDIRAEAAGYIHHLSDVVRIGLDGSQIVQAPYIYMYETGFQSSQPYGWWASDKVITIGFWARQNWQEEVVIDFFFAGSSWTASQVQYGKVSVTDQVGPGNDGYGVWIERQFWAPQNATAVYGGSVCGKIQIRPTYDSETVRVQTKEVCIKLRAVSEKG